jgi:hypothetical protein
MNTTTNTLKFRTVRRVSEYRHKYPQQQEHQRAFFALDEDSSEVYADWNGEIGNAIPFSVYHGRDRRYHFSPRLKISEVNKLGRSLLPLLERVRAGMSIEWDGNNARAFLDDDAIAAELEIEAAIEEAERMSYQYR